MSGKPEHPAIENAREVIELEERARDAAEREACNRIWRAMMLAPSLEVCEALLRGESVPFDRLDPEWVGKFGRRSPCFTRLRKLVLTMSSWSRRT